MQSLLSRSGLAHRCYCRSCSTVVQAFGGRAAAAARPRRKATFAEIFTACYSSVFATAALVDAFRKDDRRQSLDRRLEEARRDLADLRERRRVGDEPDDLDPKLPHFLYHHQMDALWRILKDVLVNRPYMKEIHKPATISASALVETLKRDYYGCHLGDAEAEAGARAEAGADAETGLGVVARRRRIDYDYLERAITAEESDKRRTYRQPHKQSHLRMETISTEELVLKFLDRAKFLPKSDLPSPSFDEACRIMRNGYPQYTFRAVDPIGAQKDTTILNERLRTLVASPEMSMRERIGRVCYNLLVTAYPPDMHTYNTLIVAFNRAGHHTFAEALVSSFFHSRLLQPTPSTYVAILNHYKCTNNHGKFLRALACLTGMDPKLGGKIRRRHVQDIEVSPLLQQWAADMTRRTRTGEWVWEHIPMTQPLLEEIICGLLHFKLFDQAVAIFFTSLNSGVRLSIRTARLLMDECVDALDWRAAVRMVRSLTSSKARWQRLLWRADAESKRELASRIRALVDICGLRGRSEPMRETTLERLAIYRYASFLKMMEQEAPLGPGSLALHDRFDASKSRLLQLESIGKELDFVSKTTMSIESKLLGSDLSHHFRASMALRIGAAATERSSQLVGEMETLLSGLEISRRRSVETQFPLGLSGQISDRAPSISDKGGELRRREEKGHTDARELSPGAAAEAAAAGQMGRAADSRPGGLSLALPVLRRGEGELVEVEVEIEVEASKM